MSVTTKLQGHMDSLLSVDDALQGAHILRAMAVDMGLSFAAVVDDYSEARLPLIEDGRALAEIFGWDQSFQSSWEDNRLHLISPIGFVCRMSTKPFTWLTESLNEIAPVADDHLAKNWHLTPERGIFGGITVPVHMPLGRVGSVGWVASTEDQPINLPAILEEHQQALRTIAYLFMDILYESRPDHVLAQGTAKLTEREVECLSWVALGKTDAEIATIIDRSVPTVRFHLENAMKKMDVANRTQAAALASQLGILGSLAR